MQYFIILLSLVSLASAGFVHPKDVNPKFTYSLTLSTDESKILDSVGGKIMTVPINDHKPDNVGKDKGKMFKFPYGIPETPNEVPNGGFIQCLGGPHEKKGGGLLYTQFIRREGSIIFDEADLNKPEEDSINKIIAVRHDDGIMLRWAGYGQRFAKEDGHLSLYGYAAKFMLTEQKNSE